MFATTAIATATMAAILAPCAQGHGWITKPMTRALCDGRSAEGTFMPGGGNGAGPGMHDLGGVPGVCGDPFQSMTDIRTNFLNEPCSIQETVPEGTVLMSSRPVFLYIKSIREPCCTLMLSPCTIAHPSPAPFSDESSLSAACCVLPWWLHSSAISSVVAALESCRLQQC